MHIASRSDSFRSYQTLQHKGRKYIPVVGQIISAMGSSGPIGNPICLSSAVLETQIRAQSEEAMDLREKDSFFPRRRSFLVKDVDQGQEVALYNDVLHVDALLQQTFKSEGK